MIDGVASPPFLIAFTLKHRAVSGGITLAVTKDNVAAIKSNSVPYWLTTSPRALGNVSEGLHNNLNKISR